MNEWNLLWRNLTYVTIRSENSIKVNITAVYVTT